MSDSTADENQGSQSTENHPAGDTTKPKEANRQDASRGEVMLYAFGNVEASIADQFFNVLNNIMIVAMHVNPMLLGLILGIKTVWDSVTDPVMAYITDNTKSRWGRRRPYILVGGISRSLLMLGIVTFLPIGGHLALNSVMEAQKFANEAIKSAADSHKITVQSLEQINTLAPDLQIKMLDVVQTSRKGAEEALEKIRNHRTTLIKDRDSRAGDMAERQTELDQARASLTEGVNEAEALAIPNGLLEAARDRLAKAEELITKTTEAERQAIAARWVAQRVSDEYGPAALPSGPNPPDHYQALADADLTIAGLTTLPIYEVQVGPAPKPSSRKGMWAGIADGMQAFTNPRNYDQRTLTIYVLFAVLLYTFFTTMQSVPYYALGIEISPSYNGRTQVVVYRSVLNQIAGLVGPWIPVFCFSVLFVHALEGLFWVATFSCLIGIPSTILMCRYVRERTEVTVQKQRKVSLFRSMWEVMQNRQFLRIFGLYWFIGSVNGIFAQIGFFLNVYWIMGSALSGAKLGAMVSMVAWGLGFLTLPLISYGCRKLQKHRMLQFAIVWMAIGTMMKWWCMNPDHPEYQFVLPFFFSVGISSVFTVLPTMMADVTDLDELNFGVRREGMFGAVMAFLMKMISAFTPILAGAVLVMSGFDPALEYHQEASTIHNMRIMYSLVPAGLLIFSLLLLRRYPLTRERVEEIKNELHKRHQQQEAEAAQA